MLRYLALVRSSNNKADQMVMTREIELSGIGAPDTLRIRTRDLPEPGRGQVLVRVEATGVSFAEQQRRPGKYYDQPPFPFVPGYDLVGIDETTGQRVAALTKVGAWADRVTYWHVHDVDKSHPDDALREIEQLVNDLIASLPP